MPALLTVVPGLVNDATGSIADGRVTVTLQFRSAQVGRVFCAALRGCKARGEAVGLLVLAQGVPGEEGATDDQ